MMLLKEAFAAWKQRGEERVAAEATQNARIQESAKIRRDQTRLAYERLFHQGGLPWSEFPFGSMLAITDSGVIDGNTSEMYDRLRVSKTPNGVHVLLSNRPAGDSQINSFKLSWHNNLNLAVAQWVAEGEGVARYEFNAFHRVLERRAADCYNGFVFEPDKYTGQYELAVGWPDAPLVSVNLTVNGEGIYPDAGNVLDTKHKYFDHTYDRIVGIRFI